MSNEDGTSQPRATGVQIADEWASGLTPDSDDQRPFPEVSEEWVDNMVRELIKAAHAQFTDGKRSESHEKGD